MLQLFVLIQASVFIPENKPKRASVTQTIRHIGDDIEATPKHIFRYGARRSGNKRKRSPALYRASKRLITSI